MEGESVDRAGAAEVVTEPLLEELESLGRDPAAGACPAARQRHGLDVATVVVDGDEEPADGPIPALPVEDVLAAIQAEALEVVHGRRRRIEGIRLLAHLEQRQPHDATSNP